MNELKPPPRPGDCVFCRIESPELGGYLVSLTASGIEGYLPSHEPIESGRVVPATFVCMNGDRALLTYAFVMGTSARVQHSTASDSENAFAIWAESYPNANRPSRAIDLIMPPFQSPPVLLKLAENYPKDLFPSLEASEFTGCIKGISQKGLSRAAVIFHYGRAVGSVYTTKSAPDGYRFEAGLRKLLDDIASPTTDIELEMYELPPDLVLAMSAMFLGCIDHRNDELDNKAYAEKMLKHFISTKTPACLSIMRESKIPCALGFISNGEFQGSYNITDRTFSEDRGFFFDLMSKNDDGNLKAYMLPEAMMTDSVRFGYSLSSEAFADKPK